VRLVYFEGILVWDERQRAEGRGAYLHRNPECISKMGQTARWERALRLSPGSISSVQVSDLCKQLFVGVQ
jgi:predicted RNA-binding protein YlxR (DUF448 family)